MPRVSLLAAVLFGAAAVQWPVAALSAGTVSVNFVLPENYTDAAYRSPYGNARERAAVMEDIRHHFQALASRRLPDGYALDIDVLDIDLAGQFEPWRFPGYDLRVVRDVTWPRMTLRYTLHQGETVVASGEQRIADQNFNFGVNIYASYDPLRYEKAMMDRWFDDTITRRIAAAQAGSHG